MLKKYIQKPLSFCLITIAIIALGVFCIFSLPVKMYPEMVKPSFAVWFGHMDIKDPNEIKKAFKRSIEEQTASISDIQEHVVTYNKNNGEVELSFGWGVDEEEVKEKLESIFNQEKAKYPNKFWYNIHSRSSQSSGRLLLSVSHKSLKSDGLNDLLKGSLFREVKKLSGVSEVKHMGWQSKRLVINFDRNQLLNYQLDLKAVINLIRNSTNTLSAGSIRKEGTKGRGIQISIPADIKDSNNLLELEIPTRNKFKSTIKLKDFATIKEDIEKSDSLFELNGKAASMVEVNLKNEGDVKGTCDEVESLLKQFKSENKGITYDIMVTPAEFIQNAVDNLVGNIVIGGIVAIIVIFFFLGTISNTVIIGISIPFCLISAFILMAIFDVSINIISLGGMAIGVGMILDSSIVSLENIFRKIQERIAINPILPIDEKIDIIINATKEVALPIFSSILTSIVVFLPIIFTKSYTEAILGDLAKTVVFTLSISALASIVIVPVACSRFMSMKVINNKSTRLFDKLSQTYSSLLLKLVKTKFRALILVFISILLFCASLFLAPKIKKEIIAVPGTKLMAINARLEGNEDIQVAKKYVYEVQAWLKKQKVVKNYTTLMWGPSRGYIIAELGKRSEFKKIQKEFKEKFPALPGIQFKPNKWDPGKMPLPEEVDMIVSISGPSDKILSEFSSKILAKRTDLKLSGWSQPWIRSASSITVDYHSWVDTNKVSTLKYYIEAAGANGTFVTEILNDGLSRGLYAQFKNEQKNNYIDQLQDMPIIYNNKIIPLKAIAKVNELKERVVPIRIKDGTRSHQVKIFLNSPENKEKQIENIKKEIDNIERADNLVVTYPDPNKEINKSFDSFKMALIISIILVFLIIALLFNSLAYPALIMATVPFAITGVLFGLWVAESTISLNSMLGTILLSGLVVNNAILFIDFYITEKNKGYDINRALSDTAKLRFRPILMTTMTTLFGVLPIALAFGESGEILQPLGISVMFGLAISTVLALFIVPAFIKIFERAK